MRTIQQNNRLWGLLAKTGLKDMKAELAFTYSGGRTDHTSELTYWECEKLIRDLSKQAPDWQDDPLNKQRRRVFHLAHELGWELANGKVDIKKLNEWLESPKCKVRKPLNKQNATEVSTTIHQLEQILRKDYEG